MRDHYPRFVGSRNYPRTQAVQSSVPSQTPDGGYPIASAATYQPDIAQYAQHRRRMAQAPAVKPIGDYGEPNEQGRAVKRTLNANKSIQILAANVPQRVLLQTIERQSFVIGNRTGAVLFVSYGSPLAFCTGFPLAQNGTLSRQGETCPIDEIWVTSSIAGAPVAVYEGKIAWLSDQSEKW